MDDIGSPSIGIISFFQCHNWFFHHLPGWTLWGWDLWSGTWVSSWLWRAGRSAARTWWRWIFWSRWAADGEWYATCVVHMWCQHVLTHVLLRFMVLRFMVSRFMLLRYGVEKIRRWFLIFFTSLSSWSINLFLSVWVISPPWMPYTYPNTVLSAFIFPWYVTTHM